METKPETKTFYNVMPEVTGGAVKKPKLSAKITPSPAAISTTSVTPTTSTKPISLPKATGRFAQKKLFMISGLIIIALLLAGGLGYYFYKKYSTKSTPEPTSTDTVQTPAPNPDVTTPGEWLQHYFGAETCTELSTCGDKADPDRDGLDNKAEYKAGTDPNNNDSDKDGIADGDEVLVFNTDPLLSKTYQDGTYLDSDFVKGGYDIKTNEPYTNERLLAIKSAIQQFGLHQPTLTTLGTLSFQLYDFTDPSLPALPADLDVTPQAKLDRDIQRQTTIKKVGAALLKYQADKKSYPPTDDFVVMADLIKSYNTVATNYNDPIARTPYVYGYNSLSNNTDFVLTYYSETQNQLIKYFAKDAQADAAKDTSKVSDQQRRLDIENIRQALLVYSTAQLDPNSDKLYVFPPVDKLKSSLIPHYMTQVPTDPVTKLDYSYEVGPNFDTFTLKTQLQNPASGTTGYMCNEEECKDF